MTGTIIVTAIDRDGNSDTLTMSDSVNFHVNIEFTPGSDDVLVHDIARIRLSDIYAVLPDVEAVFEKTCTPDNPFYIRWINRQGGFEYQMFDQNKEFEATAGGFVDFYPSFHDTTEAARTREILDMDECKDTAAVGLEQLDRYDFDRISNLIFSPRIDVYNPELARWEGITLDNTTRVTWDTRTSRGAVGFVFRLKDIQLQF